ncbi:MAG: hypothetical protein ABI663_18640 [Chryseolinea sp.]
MELKGKVVMKKFGKGSKSEHDAVYLETEKGDFVLRQVGANAFENTELKKLVGKEVIANGMVKDYLFLAKTIKEADQ